MHGLVFLVLVYIVIIVYLIAFTKFASSAYILFRWIVSIFCDKLVGQGYVLCDKTMHIVYCPLKIMSYVCTEFQDLNLQFINFPSSAWFVFIVSGKKHCLVLWNNSRMYVLKVQPLHDRSQFSFSWWGM